MDCSIYFTPEALCQVHQGIECLSMAPIGGICQFWNIVWIPCTISIIITFVLCADWEKEKRNGMVEGLEEILCHES